MHLSNTLTQLRRNGDAKPPGNKKLRWSTQMGGFQWLVDCSYPVILDVMALIRERYWMLVAIKGRGA
jgi:hypothetical protein